MLRNRILGLLRMLKRILKAKQQGLTLIEMMIAMVLGLFVTAVIITVFSTNVRSSTENLKMIRLNQELRGAMLLMADELKRAGYSADSNNSDFMAELDVSSDRKCIQFAYDVNSNSSLDNTEKIGYLLTSETVKRKTNISDCTDSTGWLSVTNENISRITTLEFNIDSSINTNNVSTYTAWTTTTGLSVYDITITLTGTTDLPHSSDANDPRRTITETIRIRNEDPKD